MGLPVILWKCDRIRVQGGHAETLVASGPHGLDSGFGTRNFHRGLANQSDLHCRTALMLQFDLDS
jgi:hypothetical protein